jgi:large subunit ribosomal protein L23
MVEKNANKIQIKKAVESLYNVTVDSVNTMVYAGKTNHDILKLVSFVGVPKHIKKQ